MPAAAVAGIGAAGSIIGGIMGNDAAKDAAKEQRKAIQAAIASQERMYAQTRGDLAPYRNVGSSSLYSLADLYGLPTPDNPEGSDAFNENALARFKLSPDYQVAMREGIGAVDASAAARGNLLSGGQIKRLADYGADLGAKGFGAYMNRLYQLAGMGENAAAQTGNAAITTGQGIANSQKQIGDANAAGIIGGFNSMSSGFGDAFNNLSFAALKGDFGGGGGSSPDFSRIY